MPDQRDNKRKHFILAGFTSTERFVTPRPSIAKQTIPSQNRAIHGTALLGQLDSLKPHFENARNIQQDAGLEDGFGIQVEFESFPDIEIAFESLARERSGIELLNVRFEEQRTYATIFVPDGKLTLFEKLIRDYIEEKKSSNGRVLDHASLVNTIQQIRTASLRALWTDDQHVFPVTDDEIFWWEVWLPIRNDRSATVEYFCRLAEAQGAIVAPGKLEFPERTVLLAYTSAGAMKRSMMAINCIAELRRAKETADFFDSLPPEEQSAWQNDLLGRCQFADTDEQTPYICLLDTGVNNGHPLIAPSLTDSDLHTIEPAWGVDDNDGHGTSMAGLALVGNMTDALSSNDPININHRLESVKILSEDGGNDGDAKHHGYLTVEAVSRPEITEPNRHRVFGMAVTARDYRDRGRPSAWSAALDGLAADVEDVGRNPRLLVVSAGNTDPNAWMEYPHSNTTDGIHDPAQSWNALTVGAYTNLTRITEPDTNEYEAIAPEGCLSPFSSTSAIWQTNWPLKPDVLFEGGNAAKDTLSALTLPSLSLLTTYHIPHERLFTTSNATSAAMALATRMAAQLMSTYPALWPETIRGLIVHSAEWTDAMRRMYLPAHASKSNYATLVRHCGYGVPDLDRALWSVSNSLTMVVESSLHPFQREEGKDPTMRDMNLHQLPWPLAELEALGETQVEMRVTLSYFIEPNPSERGFRSRYRYESHGLRFDVKRPQESMDDFRARINAAARNEEDGTRMSGDDSNWLIGKQNRHKGSIHSDIWRGSAADLASRGVIAVYPALGWWKTRKRLEGYNKSARYSLIVSIRAPEVDVDLYASITNQIPVPIMVEV
ncbi:MAG: Subtilase family protein [Deltaproteobacteria bacterium ADurb.Bin135]|nr:MAG: Subtilase family protein [Deltaproteobacteria bacterium ADurb.Bin135]